MDNFGFVRPVNQPTYTTFSVITSLSVADLVFPAGGTDLLGGALTSHVSTIQ